MMKRSIQMIALMLLLIIGACSSQENQKSNNILDFSTFKVIKPTIHHFSELGQITRAVKLETLADSLVGNIDRLRIDKKTGDILIGDFDSRKKVLRFKGTGEYITSYGNVGEAPAEYQNLIGFSTLENGDIILLSNHKLIKFTANGTFLQEIKLTCDPHEIEVIGDKIYVSVTGYFKTPKEKNAIQIYNSFLVNTGGIGQFEPRFEKYIFLGYKTLAASHNRLYFTEKYDFGLDVYDIHNQTISRLHIPSNNSALDKIWGKRHFIEADRTEIKNRLQFFSEIHCYADNLFLIAVWPEKASYDIWRLNLLKKEAIIFPMFCFFKDSSIKNDTQLYFSNIVGLDQNGLIGCFSDAEEYNRCKSDYPILKDIQFKIDDNPIIAFFQFNQGT